MKLIIQYIRVRFHVHFFTIFIVPFLAIMFFSQYWGIQHTFLASSLLCFSHNPGATNLRTSSFIPGYLAQISGFIRFCQGKEMKYSTFYRLTCLSGIMRITLYNIIFNGYHGNHPPPFWHWTKNYTPVGQTLDSL